MYMPNTFDFFNNSSLLTLTKSLRAAIGSTLWWILGNGKKNQLAMTKKIEQPRFKVEGKMYQSFEIILPLEYM